MSDRCICEDCLFAKWKQTSNGRLHPDKTGKCTWEQTVRVPPSCRGSISSFRDPGTPLSLTGGWIERGPLGFKACDVFQPK